MPKNTLISSSSTNGFFTEKPAVHNQFHEDLAFRRVKDCNIPSDSDSFQTTNIIIVYLSPKVSQSLDPELATFGDKVLSPQVLTWTGDAERNVPYLRTWDSLGRRKDELVTSEGWRNLQDLGISEGIVAIPYENRHGLFSRVHQFLK